MSKVSKPLTPDQVAVLRMFHGEAQEAGARVQAAQAGAQAAMNRYVAAVRLMEPPEGCRLDLDAGGFVTEEASTPALTVENGGSDGAA